MAGGSGDRVECGWVYGALLLFCLSLIPFLVPAANIEPEKTRPLLSPSTARPHNRVVLFIVDGLGARKALEKGLMPRFQARIKKSAFGIATASFPSITPPGLRAILSGHRMSLVEPEVPGGFSAGEEEDSVLERASAAKLRAAVFGQYNWRPLFGRHGAHIEVVDYQGLLVRHSGHGAKELVQNFDRQLLDLAEPFLAGREKWDFLVLHLFESDCIGHAFGTEDDLYRSHVAWVDRKIEDVSERLAAQAPTTFMMAADHGQEPDGSHGGTSATSTRVPFMLWGAGIKRGRLRGRPLYDAAPTLSALLGVPPPLLSEGWPALEALSATDEQKAAILRDLLVQRRARWEAVARSFPCLSGDPSRVLAEADALAARGEFAKAAALEKRYIAGMDGEMQAALPKNWFGRMIAALWLLIGAAGFGLAWPTTTRRLAAWVRGLAAATAAALALPIFFPSLWLACTTAAAALAAALLALSLVPGRGGGGPGWLLGGAWWLLSAAIALPDVLDIGLWSWLVVLSLLAVQLSRLSRAMLPPILLTTTAAAGCLVFSLGKPSPEVSLTRSLLNPLRPALRLELPWGAIAFGLLAVFGFLLWARLVRDAGARGWRVFAAAFAPALAAALAVRASPDAAALGWAFCAAGTAGCAFLELSARDRGLCLSLLCLAFYRTMTPEDAWCLAATAVLAGWGLAWKTADHNPLFEGVALLGVGLWAYTLTGGEVQFGHIVAAEGFRALAGAWRPHELAAAVLLKYLALFAAPILPFMCSRSFLSILAMVPLLGAFCAGNLSMVWWDRFMIGDRGSLTDQAGYQRTLFALLVAWTWLTLWTLVRGLDRVSRPRI